MRKRQLLLGISVRNHHASPFNTPLGGAQCCSVHNVNHCFESTWGEAKTHRHNRVSYQDQPQRLPAAISLELAIGLERMMKVYSFLDAVGCLKDAVFTPASAQRHNVWQHYAR